MENASKAILIAGGILVSLIVASIFVYSFMQISNFVDDTSENPYQQQLADFNSGFEAYDKKLMYGIDLISVLNQAIDNNRRYRVEFYDSPDEEDNLDYYVNVVFTYNTRNIEGDTSDNFVTYTLKDNYTRNDATNIIKNKFLIPISKNDSSIHGFKVAAFKCNKVLYNKNNEVTTLGTERKN